jgi:hypothetical protein
LLDSKSPRMPSARLGTHRFTWQLAVLLLVGGTVVVACSSSHLGDGANNTNLTPDGSLTCSPGRQGCSCDTEGETVACGSVKETFGTYVTCVQGNSTCIGGSWGPCIGDTTVVAQSLGGATLGGGGIQVLVGNFAPDGGTCDPCDPNCGPPSGGNLPDGAPVVVTEAGITLPSTTTQGGGGDGAACSGLGCQVDWSCPANSPTTISGIVYDPAGNNPLYDAYVYIPVDPDPTHLPAFTAGVTCDQCAGAGNLNAVAVAQTDPTGAFKLTNVPSQQYGPGKPIPLVIQMGKWRRVTMLPSYAPCTSSAVPAANSRLPRNQTDGYSNHADMPQVAFVSGSADPFECMLLKAGIDPNEFGSSSKNSNRRFHYYNSPDSPGSSIDPAFGNVVTGDTMWNNSNGSWNLSAYDVVILACEGSEYDVNDRTANGYTNLVSYSAAGGRVFLSHFSYVWMKYNNPWINVVGTWGGTGTTATQDPLNATIYTTGFAKGQAFQTWLGDQPQPNALSGGTLTIHQARQDFANGLASGVQPWMTAVDTANGAFGGGVCASPSCGTNSDCNTGVCNGAIAGTCATGSCFANSDCSGGGTCSGAKAGTCFNGASCHVNSDCGNGHTCHNAQAGSCSGGTATSCLHNSDCGSGTCNNLTQGTCTCNSGNDCPGNNNTCSPSFYPSFTFNTPLTAQPANQCGRVDFSDFHVATSAQVSGNSCSTNADCGYGATCSGANGIVGTCSSQACDADQSTSSQCGDSNFSCPGGTAGKCGCYSNNDCSSMGAGTCPGGSLGTCGSTTCVLGSSCTSGTCTGGTAGTCSCYASSECSGGGTCSGSARQGSCSGHGHATCDTAANCHNGDTCNGAVAGTCSVKTCGSASDCSATGATCTGGVSGKCACESSSQCNSHDSCGGTISLGTCTGATCYANADCTAGNGTCTGSPSDGTCAANTCTSNSQCSSLTWNVGHGTVTGQEQCTSSGGGGNTCNGCFTNFDCPGATSTCVGGAAPGTCVGGSSNFPYECAQGYLDPQEAALEFEFFDLSACVTPNNQPPPGPPTPVTQYNPATFTVDFQSTCPVGTYVRWRELDWQAIIPATSSIVFSAQTAPAAADGGLPNYAGVQSVPLATATTSTVLPGWDAAILDTSGASGTGGTGLLNTATPPVVSQADLRISITLNPTTDKSAAPTLIQWQVKSDCIPAE